MKKSITIFFLISISLIVFSCSKEGSVTNSVESVDRVEDLLSKMTLDEKIGQMTQVEYSVVANNQQEIKNYFIGSILSGGGSGPSNNTAASWADAYDKFQSYALQTRLKIPIIYGIDAVHGHNNIYGATIFPHNIGLGCTRNPSIVEQAAQVTAEEVAGTGIDWTFSPCIAVPQDERWGRTYEGFGETPDLTKQMAAAAVRGFQTTTLGSTGSSILACAKHFLGDGGTTNGIDQGNTQVDEATISKIHLPGYISAIESDVGSIMISYSSVNGQKMHGSKYWITDVLKGELGFKGFIISDYSAINQLGSDFKSDVEMSINAGIDMVMLPFNYKEFFSAMKSLLSDGRIPMSRVDDAVRRILKIKFQLGLFDHPYTDRSLTSKVGSAEHRAVARDAVRQSLVLLKNENNVLPLRKNFKRIHVAGSAANDIGIQCGGWTITWQGSSGDITKGTTILQAIKSVVSAETIVTYSLDGSGAQGADVGVVVVGEKPYAEGAGYKYNLYLSSEDQASITKMKASGIPIVTVLISGRPMLLDNVLSNSDALIAAWLPGTEGLGVADVLFGDYKPTGKLSHSWPRMMSQIPVNVGDANYDPLFTYGFGLSY